MYESFYGFREKPFSLLPDPAFLYLGRKHRIALTMLEYGMMKQSGFTVITGEIGSGKTTLIRRLLGQIGGGRDLNVGLVSNAHQSFGELMQWVLLAFKLDYRGKEKVELYQCLAEFMAHEFNQGRRTVLIIDEAQNLDPGTLEELRMLSNINADKDQILQLILVGQPELRDKLRRPDLTQFAQRIAVDFHLGVLDLQETCEYIRHRLVVAGGDPNLFEPEASVAVHYYARGTPRLINIICDITLVCAYAEQKKKIDADLVHDVMRDKSVGGLLPVWRDEQETQDVVLDINTAKKRGS